MLKKKLREERLMQLRPFNKLKHVPQYNRSNQDENN